MYRDESETLLDDGHSHSLATAFLRNFRCSAVMSTNVWVCQTVKNRLNYNTPLATHSHAPATRLNTTAGSSSQRHTAATELVHGTVETTPART